MQKKTVFSLLRHKEKNQEKWSSPEDKLDLNWSGNRPGTSGPGEIDDESTFDSF